MVEKVRIVQNRKKYKKVRIAQNRKEYKRKGKNSKEQKLIRQKRLEQYRIERNEI